MPIKSRKSFKSFSGNTLTEYALPLTLIVVVMSAAIVSSGMYNRLLGLFSGSTNDWSGSGATAKVAPLGSPVLPLSASMLAPPTNPTDEQVCFASGTCINLPTNGTEAGAGLGDEDISDMSDLLDRINEQLKKIKGMEQVSNLVEKLAKQGHGMADKMREIQRLCPDICSGNEETSANDLLSQIKKERAQFQDIWEELENYLNDRANADLFARFPEARNIIDSKVAEIKRIVDAIDAQTHEAQSDPDYNCDHATQMCNKVDDSGDWYRQVAKQAGTSFHNTEDDGVHQDSNTICGQGGGPACFRKNNNGEWEPIFPQT
jgi:Flp pilus assembly pilin Flp/uncharacterized protein YukE